MELNKMVLDEYKVYIIAEKVYYGLLAVCLAVIALFSYMTWYFYDMMQNTPTQKFAILIALPILVAIILLIMLLLAGKQATAKEIATFLGAS